LPVSRGVLPPEVSAAILGGESRLKAIRNWRGETQLHLNFKTGIGQGYLSDLENGRRTGTPETIAKLAQALDVPVEGAFVDHIAYRHW
jgi:transcriptional regulator with XRE-family HTH domain